MKPVWLFLALAPILAGATDPFVSANVQVAFDVSGRPYLFTWLVEGITNSVTLDGAVVPLKGSRDLDPFPHTYTLVATGQDVTITLVRKAPASGIVPSVPAPPTPIPVPIPPPGPTDPVLSPSAVGAESPPLPVLIAADRSVWTLKNGVVYRDGVDMKAYYPAPLYLFVRPGPVVCEQDKVHGYVCWNGTAWAP